MATAWATSPRTSAARTTTEPFIAARRHCAAAGGLLPETDGERWRWLMRLNTFMRRGCVTDPKFHRQKKTGKNRTNLSKGAV